MATSGNFHLAIDTGNNSISEMTPKRSTGDRSPTAPSAVGQPAHAGHHQAGGPGCDQQRPCGPASAPPHQRHSIGRWRPREERQSESCCRDHSGREKKTGTTRCRYRHAASRQACRQPAPPFQSHWAPFFWSGLAIAACTVRTQCAVSTPSALNRRQCCAQCRVSRRRTACGTPVPSSAGSNVRHRGMSGRLRGANPEDPAS